MYVIYHDPTKRRFTYGQKSKQMQQISMYEYELSMKFLLCQDAIFHRIPTPLDIELQRTPPKYVESQVVLDGQRNYLWIKDNL